jgi:hypothetical protein
MKKLLLLFCSALLLVLPVSQAFAFSLGGFQGGIEIDFDGWSDSALFGTDNKLSASDDGTDIGYADGDEDVWVIGQLNSFESSSGGTLWTNGDGNEWLTGIIYNVDDIDDNGGAGTTEYLSAGINGSESWADGKIRMDLYLTSAASDPFVLGATSLRNGAAGNLYPTVTDGSLFLSLEFEAGFFANYLGFSLGVEEDAQLWQQYTANSQTGSGLFYASVVGGAYDWMFDTNGFLAPDGTTTADILGNFRYDQQDIATDPDNGGPDTPYGDKGWDFELEDPLRGSAVVPEPATLLLFGIGLLGLANAGRRKRS